MKNLFEKNVQKATSGPSISIAKLAKINALLKSLESLRDEICSEAKLELTDYFATLDKRPASFDIEDTNCKANVQLRRRSSASALSDEEIEVLKKHKVSVEKKVKQEESFTISQKYAKDKRLLAKVSKALSGIVPEDFIEYREEQSVLIASDDSLDAIFRMEAKDARALLPVVSTLAIKTTFEDLDAIMEIIEGIDL